METRARIADSELEFYEDIIAGSLEVLHRLEPVLARAIQAGSDDIQHLLMAATAANYVRQHTIEHMNGRKSAAATARNGK